MNRSLELAQEKDASFADFLLYFLRLGTVGFGGPIALATVWNLTWLQSEAGLRGRTI